MLYTLCRPEEKTPLRSKLRDLADLKASLRALCLEVSFSTLMHMCSPNHSAIRSLHLGQRFIIHTPGIIISFRHADKAPWLLLTACQNCWFGFGKPHAFFLQPAQAPVCRLQPLCSLSAWNAGSCPPRARAEESIGLRLHLT